MTEALYCGSPEDQFRRRVEAQLVRLDYGFNMGSHADQSPLFTGLVEKLENRDGERVKLLAQLRACLALFCGLNPGLQQRLLSSLTEDELAALPVNAQTVLNPPDFLFQSPQPLQTVDLGEL